MKITSISVKNYGPVSEFMFEPANFECIFGHNESGKTAIVELLVYILFKRTIAHLRFSKPDHIKVVIDTDNKRVVLPSKKRLPRILPLDITPLLYVQASESSLYTKGNQNRFWDGLKTLLGDMESGVTIAKIDERIFESVGLKPKQEEWKEDKQQKIDQLLKQKELLGQYIAKVAQIEQVHSERSRLEIKRESLAQKCQTIDTFKQYTKYRELSELYEQFCAKQIALKQYDRYKPIYLDRWQELELMQRSSSKTEDVLQRTEQEIIELQKQKMELQRKQDFIDAGDLKGHNIPEESPRQRTTVIIPSIINIIMALIFIISFFTPIPTVIAAPGLLISVVVTGYILYKNNLIGQRAAKRLRILRKAQRIFPNISTISELGKKVTETQEEMIRVTTLLYDKQEFKKQYASKGALHKIAEELVDIRNKTGLAELDDLKAKVQERNALEEQYKELFYRISSILGDKDHTKWNRALQKMKIPAPESEPDTSRLENFKKELAHTEKELQELEKQVAIFEEIQKTTYNITDPGSAFQEYDRLEKKLQEYDLEKEAALAARVILKELSQEQDDYIHDVVSGEQSLSEYFALVTGRYRGVSIRDNEFIAQDVNGHEYQVDTLSSGTKDQLLLCFRFAVLQKSYPRGTFILLDDAFIFADWERRKKMMELITSFVKKGNQVLYFTSDDHTRDLFAAHGAQIYTLPG